MAIAQGTHNFSFGGYPEHHLDPGSFKINFNHCTSNIGDVEAVGHRINRYFIKVVKNFFSFIESIITNTINPCFNLPFWYYSAGASWP